MKDKYEDEPARRVQKRGDQKKVNRQAAGKVRGIVQTESMLESNILIAGEIDPRVDWMVPQPVTFDVNTGEVYSTKKAMFEAHSGNAYKPRAYTPDFRFDLSNGRQVFVEGKHTHWLKKHPEFEDVLSLMKSLGHRFLVVTEEAFSPALQRNLRMLKAHPTEEICTDLQATIMKSLPTPKQASDVMQSFGLRQSDLLTGLLSGLFSTDLRDAPLGPKSMLQLGHGETSHLEVLAL